MNSDTTNMHDDNTGRSSSSHWQQWASTRSHHMNTRNRGDLLSETFVAPEVERHMQLPASRGFDESSGDDGDMMSQWCQTLFCHHQREEDQGMSMNFMSRSNDSALPIVPLRRQQDVDYFADEEEKDALDVSNADTSGLREKYCARNELFSGQPRASKPSIRSTMKRQGT